MEPPFLLAVDQGTTSTRAILFSAGGEALASHAIQIEQLFPNDGWVEQDAMEIWRSVVACCQVVARGVAADEIAGIGVANQRETVVVWDRATGKPIHNAIVWQDRRTAQRCRLLRQAGLEGKIAARTGLVLDPYFSATKVEWLLDNVPGARQRAETGELAFGTVDSWLVWNLTGGAVHATDVTNASRTMLLDLNRLAWDQDLMTLFGIPSPLLPKVLDSACRVGETTPRLFGGTVPILGIAGDQQAAMIGQACFTPGDVKSTYGTGCFALVNTGPDVTFSENRLIATCAYRLGGKSKYAVEGSIFAAGSVVQWLSDRLRLFGNAAEIEQIVRGASDASGVYFVPAFNGLGAPYWDPDARAAIVGLTRDVGVAEIAKAALDAVCFQTRDLIEAMARDMEIARVGAPKTLRVDGGMVRNDWFCQRLADLSGLPVERPKVIETTALGAAYLAGLSAGLYRDEVDLGARWALERRFEPSLAAASRDKLYKGWNAAVARVRSV